MTRDEFRLLAETWGGNVERWPEAVRTAARALARTPDGAAVLTAERRLDAVFAQAPVVTQRRAGDVAFAVMQRLAADRSPEAPSQPLSTVLRWLVPAAALACSVLLGVALALQLPFARGPEPAAAIVAMATDSASMASDWGLR